MQTDRIEEMQDRRLHPRAPAALHVECRLSGTKGQLKARSRDISGGGLAILTSARLQVGADLSAVGFTLPADGEIPEQTIELRARVVRCDETAEEEFNFLAGLRFLDPPEDIQERIERFVFQRLRFPEDSKRAEDTPAKRIPFVSSIAVRYELFKDFVQEVSSNLSTTGMFIRTSDPKPQGSVLEFSFDMGEDFTLMQGKGEVVWVRAKREGPDRPPGMGVRFVDLDTSSRNVIERMVKDYIDQGFTPFDLEATSPADPPLGKASLRVPAEAKTHQIEKAWTSDESSEPRPGTGGNGQGQDGS